MAMLVIIATSHGYFFQLLSLFSLSKGGNVPKCNITASPGKISYWDVYFVCNLAPIPSKLGSSFLENICTLPWENIHHV